MMQGKLNLMALFAVFGEADGMKLENCPAYVREWIEREKD